MIWIGAGILLGLLSLAVKVRMKNNRYRYNGEGAVSTPLAEALAQLAGIAGGIYVSLLLVLSFLGIEGLSQVSLFGVEIDPLALIALLLACGQPLLLWFLRRQSK